MIDIELEIAKTVREAYARVVGKVKKDQGCSEAAAALRLTLDDLRLARVRWVGSRLGAVGIELQPTSTALPSNRRTT